MLYYCRSITFLTTNGINSKFLSIGSEPLIFYATGTLSVKFLRPAPLNKPWVFRARVKEISERKITVSCSVFAKEKEFASGEIVAIRMNM